MKTKECLLLFAALAGSVSLFAAPPKLPVIFGDHMVLQRDRELTIPGVSLPGDQITVSLAGKTFQGTADENGNFKVKAGPFAAGGPYELTVTGKDGATTFKDLLVGEVWMCSGQSNMQWSVQQSVNGPQEVANANYPQIRHFLVPRTVAVTPMETVKAVNDMKMRAAVGMLYLSGSDAELEEKNNAINQELEEKRQWIEEEGKIHLTLGPHAIYTVSREKLLSAAEKAKNENYFIHIHLAETRSEFENCKKEHGMTPTEYRSKRGKK